jgi:predicted acyltransferase
MIAILLLLLGSVLDGLALMLLTAPDPAAIVTTLGNLADLVRHLLRAHDGDRLRASTRSASTST